MTRTISKRTVRLVLKTHLVLDVLLLAFVLVDILMLGSRFFWLSLGIFVLFTIAPVAFLLVPRTEETSWIIQPSPTMYQRGSARTVITDRRRT